MKTNYQQLNLAFLAMMALILSVSNLVYATGPVSVLYATAPGMGKMYVIQGENVINTWVKYNSGESPIAVMDTIRTSNQSWGGQPGAEYTLSGIFTGTTYPGYWEHYDGTTDGSYNYSVDYGGNVYKFNRDWTDPVRIFGTTWGTYSTGITYDPTNNSLWFSYYGGSEIENLSMTGQLLSSFTTVLSPTFLAMDYADGTLWTASRYGNALYQYSRTGALLSSQTYSDPDGGTLFGGGFFGAEFQFQSTPEPATIAFMALGGLAIVRRRRA
jgi:hypothetical protein